MPIVDARVIIVWATDAGSAINTIDARYDDALHSAQDVADSFVQRIEDNFLSSLANTVSLTQVQVGDDVAGAIANSGQAGGDSSGVTNPSVAYGVTKVVGTGRSGRWFVPGVTEPAVNGSGLVAVSKRAQLQGHMDQFLTDMESDGVDMRVKQKDLTYAQIDSFSVRPYITLQSRRLDRARGF